MMDLKQYMKKTGVTKKKYVDEWIDQKLIPGAIREGDKYSFLDSSRRPYRPGKIRQGLSADKIRAHIVKATINRQHFNNLTFLMSKGEFQTMIKDLSDANLIVIREEDGITYYDSTLKSDEYMNKSLKEIEKFVKECLGIVVEKGTKGAVTAMLNHGF